ncbi:QDR1 [Candida pseudojiufengensis]|uniref:QDR1 n=1 Tax=Candida pseudojiufengensis TaxID=497109 RepID=UPI002224034A|nr:QDR1 [Candida pseudojiufengensis]KAI5962445.1 QDR1 [Candida pseudojiufengensis]
MEYVEEELEENRIDQEIKNLNENEYSDNNDEEYLNINSRKSESIKSKSLYPYTIFEKNEKILLIIILSSIGFWSTCSSPIYFPALPTLTKYFNTTESIMNISVVCYLLFQGIVPTISSNLADTFGRRPVILASLLIYIASCIALSQTNVYWLLAVLRCIQAAGIAPVIAISSGVSGDVCTPANRGSMVGATGGLQLMGNGLGGLFGAALISGFHTWRSIFVFLAIGGGVTFIGAFFFLAETSRQIVGNGTVMPKNIMNRAVLIYMPFFKKKMSNDIATIEPKKKFDILGPFKIFIKKEVFLVLVPSGLHFAAWSAVLTSLSTELESSKYNYGVMHVGLIYLPQGIATLVASMGVGKLMNIYYAYRKRLFDEKMKNVPKDQRPAFNIVATRLTLTIVPAALMIIGLIIFGWCIQYERHIISIIISTILISFSSSVFIAICTTMLVDLYPNQGSASTSCLNLMRCWLAALFVGVLDKMIKSLNLGGTYTLMAGLCLLFDLCLIYVLYCTNKELRDFSSNQSTRVSSTTSSVIE